MTALAADVPGIKLRHAPGIQMSLPVKADTVIYEGAAVSDSGGNGLAAPLTAAEAFCGFARRKADNSGGAAGAISVEVIPEGFILNVAITGGNGNTDHGVAVYMSDDNTFTLTSTSNTLVGKVWSYNGSTFTVRFTALAMKD